MTSMPGVIMTGRGLPDERRARLAARRYNWAVSPSGGTYREYAPPAALAPWVECFWQSAAGREPRTQRILPDGCMDLVWTAEAGLRVVGPNTAAFLATLPAGGSATGVRLHPGGAPPLFRLPAPLLVDTLVHPGDLWGPEGRRLEERIAEATSPWQRQDVLAGWLAARATAAPAPDPVVAAVTARLAAGAVSVARLARDLAYSERQLHRRVVAEVGYGPKRLGRILRLRRALAAAGGRAGDLAGVAHDHGFADQAHFSNECLALAGVPPTALLTS